VSLYKKVIRSRFCFCSRRYISDERAIGGVESRVASIQSAEQSLASKRQVGSSADALKQGNWPRVGKKEERKLLELQSAGEERKPLSLNDNALERERAVGQKSDGRFSEQGREREKVGARVRRISGSVRGRGSDELGAEVADELEEGLTPPAEEAEAEAGQAMEELIDPGLDPMEKSCRGPDEEWVKEIRSAPVRVAEVPLAEEHKKRMRVLINQLESEPKEPDEARVEEAKSWLAKLPEGILNHEEFVACSFAQYLPAWEELLKNSPRKSAKAVLGWLRRGFKPRFVGTRDAKPQKRVIVESMLRKVVPNQRVEPMLEGKYPHQITFQNHRSLYLNWGFSRGELRKLVIWGVASIWNYEDGKSVVINPLGVAESAGKLRLICNARYINLFLESLPFRYERLRDILTFMEEGSFMATWDLKAGYFHVPIHPKFRKYFAFRVGGVTFAFNVLCFGFAQACYVFTKVMQEPVFELRRRGIPISYYIDDGYTAARTYIRCLRQSATSGQFFSALGAYFGLPKCQFDPVQLLRWLGFLIDSERQEFRLSESKVEKLKEAFRRAMSEPSTSAKKNGGHGGKDHFSKPSRFASNSV
jgi:hypothetical protein